MGKSSKSYIIAVSLSGIFGILGVQHFYLGRWVYGLFDLTMTISSFFLIFMGLEVYGFLLLAIDIIHNLIITIMLLTGTYKDGEGNVVTYPGQLI